MVANKKTAEGIEQHGAESGTLLLLEHIRPKLCSIDSALSDVLDRRPVLRVNENLRSDPIRDGLLGERGIIPEELPYSLRQQGLATRDIDRPLQGNDVRLLHEDGGYTNRFVESNIPVCVTGHKIICKVLPMSRSALKKPKVIQRLKTKKSVRARPGRQPEVFRDGKTLGVRIKEAMDDYSAKLGREYKQSHLVRDIAARYGIEEDGIQQVVSNAMTKGSVCKYTPAIAIILNVNVEWLSNGYGEKRSG